MSKEMVKNLIDLIPESDIDTIYKVIVKFHMTQLTGIKRKIRCISMSG